ncbi:hypothetical protein SAMN05192553_10572 [Cyclobacterium xiamenense]|uniref:Uncharacterized protein n=1 Tax=Cyclobacterium xiamenense TaxID=1297121 RepID=A0A1H6ZW20_9BACT|nr:hypothetical protein SAMN05192553_10572 [Cyclobacterium xiamenense]
MKNANTGNGAILPNKRRKCKAEAYAQPQEPRVMAVEQTLTKGRKRPMAYPAIIYTTHILDPLCPQMARSPVSINSALCWLYQSCTGHLFNLYSMFESQEKHCPQ